LRSFLDFLCSFGASASHWRERRVSTVNIDRQSDGEQRADGASL
jgi:hypothetical protein